MFPSLSDVGLICFLRSEAVLSRATAVAAADVGFVATSSVDHSESFRRAVVATASRHPRRRRRRAGKCMAVFLVDVAPIGLPNGLVQLPSTPCEHSRNEENIGRKLLRRRTPSPPGRALS